MVQKNSAAVDQLRGVTFITFRGRKMKLVENKIKMKHGGR